MKHIYMYMAPAYFTYLLCNYCFQFKSRKLIESFSVRNTAYLGVVVLGVFVVTFLPFYDHLGQVSWTYESENIIDVLSMFRFCRGCFRLREDSAMRTGRPISGHFIMLSTRQLRL